MELLLKLSGRRGQKRTIDEGQDGEELTVGRSGASPRGAAWVVELTEEAEEEAAAGLFMLEHGPAWDDADGRLSGAPWEALGVVTAELHGAMALLYRERREM